MSFPKLLKIAVLQLYQMIELQLNQNNSIELKSGTDANLIKDMSKSIGFDYVICTPADGEWGRRKPDGNWTGTLGMLDRGEVDMAVALLSITEDRYKSFTFIPYTIFQFVFVTNKPNFYKPVTSRFGSPFQTEVWIACLSSFLAIALMLWFTSRRDCSFIDAVTKSLKILLRQDLTIRRYSFATRTVVGNWKIASMILTLSYSSVLLSFMTLPVRDEGIRTIDELSEAVINRDYKFLYTEGSIALELLSRSPKLSSVTEKFMKMKDNWTYEFVDGSSPQHFDSKTALFGPKIAFQMQYGVEPRTSKVITEDSITDMYIGVAVKKTFCCIKTLQKCISHITAGGIYDEYVRKVQTETSYDLPTVSADDTIRPLSLTDLREVFIFGLFGIFSAFLILLIEILTSYM